MSGKRFKMAAAILICVIIAASTALYFFRTRPTGMAAIQALVRHTFPEVSQLSTTDLAGRLARSSEAAPILVDVRSEEEYAISHLKGARRVDPDGDPNSVLAGVAKDAEIVVYCSVGYRSSKFARALQKEGFTRVSNLEGSIFKWANEGRQIYDESKEVHSVHPYDETWGELLQPQLRADIRKSN